METTERGKYDMFVKVSEFGNAHGDLFPAASVAGQAFEAVDEAVTQLSEHAVSKMSARRGGTSTKARARKALSDRLEAIVVSARAIGQNTPGLEDKFRNPNPRTDQSLITAGRLFARDAEAFKAQFIARAMPKTFIADLEGLVEAFDQAIREREAERNAHTAARASIEAAVSAGMLAIRQLDAVVVNHLHDDPVTMAVWKRDRRIQYPHRPQNVVTAPAPPPAVAAPETRGGAS